jgi:hypothetical protein
VCDASQTEVTERHFQQSLERIFAIDTALGPQLQQINWPLLMARIDGLARFLIHGCASSSVSTKSPALSFRFFFSFLT